MSSVFCLVVLLVFSKIKFAVSANDVAFGEIEKKLKDDKEMVTFFLFMRKSLIVLTGSKERERWVMRT